MVRLSSTLLFAATALAFPAPLQSTEPEFITARGLGPVDPSQDDFYRPPANVSAYKPGDVIRARHPPIGLRFFGGKANLADSYQLLYRTTSPEGEPLVTVTTVMIPHNADYSKFLSYQVEVDAPTNACQPSITLQQPLLHVDNISGQYGELWYISALERGWIVSSPDHEGPNAAFGAAILGGKAVLDGVRAVQRASHLTGVKQDAKIAIWGYSGGAMATELALELQRKYAPELNITAGAVGGVPANFKNLLFDYNKGPAVGLTISGTYGLVRAYPRLKTLVDQQLLPAKKEKFEKLGQQCLIPNVIEFAFNDLFSYFRDGERVFHDEYVDGVLNENIMGSQGTPKVPVYMYHALTDELLPFQDTEALYNQYCKAGASIHFVKDLVGGHITTAIAGAPGALEWISDRLDGKPADPGCSMRTLVSSFLDFRNLESLGTITIDDIKTLLSNPVGPLAKSVSGQWP